MDKRHWKQHVLTRSNSYARIDDAKHKNFFFYQSTLQHGVATTRAICVAISTYMYVATIYCITNLTSFTTAKLDGAASNRNIVIYCALCPCPRSAC
jgi:hypothetical protein